MTMHWADAELLHQAARELDRRHRDLTEQRNYCDGQIVAAAVSGPENAEIARALVSLAKPSEGSLSKAKPGRGVTRTFDVQPDINKLLDQVGVTDDWIGAVFDAFVIDYVFDRPLVVEETMEEFAPLTCKVCGDPYSAHQHYRSGTDCAQCTCPRYRARRRAPST